MEHTKLGQTDIEISKVCVGCMSFGKAGTMHDWTLDETATEDVVKHDLDLGINFFDTSNGYSTGTSEEYLGRVLRKNAARGVASPIVGATKAKYLDDAVAALDVCLSPDEVAYLEELYCPHRVVDAIDCNPPEGVMLLDEKK